MRFGCWARVSVVVVTMGRDLWFSVAVEGCAYICLYRKSKDSERLHMLI